MCDFSLQMVKSRPAVVGDKVTTSDFGYGTVGFCETGQENASRDDRTAVCVMPGTEIGFSAPIKFWKDDTAGWFYNRQEVVSEHSVGIFRQIDKDTPMTHHDALELPNGEIVKLTRLYSGQHAHVLQLPAAPKNEAEAKEQTRLEVVG